MSLLHLRPTSWRSAAGLFLLIPGFLIELAILHAPNVRVAIAVTSIALAPFVVFLTLAAPAFVCFLLLASQPLEAFELNTPAGTFSPGIVLLMAVLVLHHSRILKILGSSPRTGVLAVLICAWIIAHLLRLAHTPSDQVLRNMLALSSFAAAWFVGVWFGAERWVPTAAKGATLALLFLGLAGVSVGLGLLPPPDRVAAARSILGLTSPLPRNYGLSVQFDAVALLVPLALPMLTYWMMTPRELRTRVWSTLLLLALGATFLLTFQSRSLILQALAGIAMTAYLLGRVRWLGVVTIVTAPFILTSIYNYVYTADPISSSLRADGIRLALDILSGPDWIATGISNQEVLQRFQGMALWWDAVATNEGYPTIHNMFLSEFVGGGIMAGTLLLAIYLFSASNAMTVFRSGIDPAFRIPVVVGFALATLEILVDPIAANVMGLWVLLGMIAGLAATTPRKPVPVRTGRQFVRVA